MQNKNYLKWVFEKITSSENKILHIKNSYYAAAVRTSVRDDHLSIYGYTGYFILGQKINKYGSAIKDYSGKYW